MSYFSDSDGMRQQQEWDRQWASDGRVSGTFGVVPELDERESAAQGRPIYVDKVYLRILTAGDAYNIVHREMRDEDRERFKDAWQKFQAGASQIAGTPLEACTFISRAQAEELKRLPGAPVRTVEELAALDDVSLQRLPGVRRLAVQARDFIRASREAAPLTAMRADIEQRDAKIAELEAAREQDAEEHRNQIAALAARLDNVEQATRGPSADKARR